MQPIAKGSATADRTNRTTEWGPLCCPACPRGKEPLSLDREVWLVGDCRHRFPIREGIPILLPDEAERWSHVGSDANPEQRHEAVLDLSVVIPALDEARNLELLLPQLVSVLDDLHITFEVLIVIRGIDRSTDRVVEAHAPRCRVLEQTSPGYGGAVRTGIDAASATYIVTMDADLSHRPDFLRGMWQRRTTAELLVASRYVRGGKATMPILRKILSRTLNVFFRRGLSIGIRDMSSGFRLMRSDAIRRLPLHASGFDLVQEALVRAYCQGWSVCEVPMRYAPRRHGASHARVLPFGIAYLRTFGVLWKLRNSIAAADYDDRAFDSLIPLQRYWQRTRYEHVTSLVDGKGPVLDVGCGSSRIIGSLAPGSVAVDILLPKLRYARRFGIPVVNASGFALPYSDSSFPCVLSSEVIEHVPRDSPILDELCRVLAPGGRLVLGTPDYDSRLWCKLEAVYARVAPGGYMDEHITHYTRTELVATMGERGLSLEDERDILGAEIILAFRKQ